VYRGESAQKGRFREFYQCDADVVGKDRLSIEYDAEVVALVAAVFGDLQVGDFEIRVNNRKVLVGFLASLGVVDPAEQAGVLREVDKLDKVGVDRVAAALRGGGSAVQESPVPGRVAEPSPLPDLTSAAVDRLLRFVEIGGPGGTVVSRLSSLGVDDDTYRAGVEELAAVAAAMPRYGVSDACWGIHVAIARGLDYYTGTVCETYLRAHPEIGSVCSGGRYDDLAGYYTKSRLPGVGVSIGATRLFDQLQARGLLSGAGSGGADVVVLRFAPALAAECLAIGTELRAAGIATEVLLEDWAPKKQLAWASQRGARFAIILGEDEHARGVVALKDLTAKAQEDVPRAQIAAVLTVRRG
jgi:histidyl-tRNA synthetase